MEWNQPYSKQQLRTNNDVTLYGEIVQIGAVKMDDGFNITDTFKVTVKPTVYKKMNKRVTRITGITDEVISNSGVDRDVAYKSFLNWCGEDSTFITWGDDDYDMLSKNMKFFGMMLLNATISNVYIITIPIATDVSFLLTMLWKRLISKVS